MSNMEGKGGVCECLLIAFCVETDPVHCISTCESFSGFFVVDSQMPGL